MQRWGHPGIRLAPRFFLYFIWILFWLLQRGSGRQGWGGREGLLKVRFLCRVSHEIYLRLCGIRRASSRPGLLQDSLEPSEQLRFFLSIYLILWWISEWRSWRWSGFDSTWTIFLRILEDSWQFLYCGWVGGEGLLEVGSITFKGRGHFRNWRPLCNGVPTGPPVNSPGNTALLRCFYLFIISCSLSLSLSHSLCQMHNIQPFVRFHRFPL